MNEQQLSDGLRAAFAARATLPDHDIVRRRILDAPIETVPQRRAWVPVGLGRRSLAALTTVVAAGVVALFGALALTGLLVPSPDDDAVAPIVGVSATPGPNAIRAPLPGVDLELEELERGVYRVLGDGVRDPSGRNEMVVAGRDGSVWLFGRDAFFRLGDPTTHEWSNPDFALREGDGSRQDDIEVGPDGTIWWVDRGRGSDRGLGAWRRPSGDEEDGWRDRELRAFDGRAWSVVLQRPDVAVDEVEVLPDGTVLVAWTRPRWRVIARRVGDDWEVIGRGRPRSDEGDPIGGATGSLIAESSTRIWWQRCGGATLNPLTRGDFPDGVATGDGEWTQVARHGAPCRRLPVGKGGQGSAAGPVRAGWAVGADGLDRIVMADADCSEDDCVERTGFLPGVEIGFIDVDEAGNAWVLGGRASDRSLYLITPDATEG